MARRSRIQQMTKPPKPDWLTGAEAGRVLGGVDPRQVKKLALAGLIGVRDLKGVRAIYWREHVEELYRASHTNRTTVPPKVPEGVPEPKPGW